MRTLTIADLSFGDVPFIKLRHSNEKSRKGSTIALRRDLAAELREWIQGRDRSETVFNVPSGILRIMNRDLAAAGIDKTESREESQKLNKTLKFKGFSKSGREDLNLRPLRPERTSDGSDDQRKLGVNATALEGLHHCLHQFAELDTKSQAELLRSVLGADGCERLIAALAELTE